MQVAAPSRRVSAGPQRGDPSARPSPGRLPGLRGPGLPPRLTSRSPALQEAPRLKAPGLGRPLALSTSSARGAPRTMDGEARPPPRSLATEDGPPETPPSDWRERSPVPLPSEVGSRALWEL